MLRIHAHRMRAAAALIAFVAASCGQPQRSAPEIGIDDVWARSTVPGKTATAAYLTLSNRGGEDDALVGVTSSVGTAALHSSSMAGGIMRMRQLDRLVLPAGATVSLQPGGTHVMLTKLNEPLTPGGTIELSLRFEKSAERTVAGEIRDPSGEQM